MSSHRRTTIVQLANQLWHTDSSFKPVPAMASLLSGREVPPAGGETEFVSMRRTWEALPEAMRTRLNGRVVVHSILDSRSTIAPGLFDPEHERGLPPVRQALVRANPVNGRRTIYIGSHAWDNNRCVLHRGRPWDSERHRRVMRRTTVAGEGPTAEPPLATRTPAWDGIIAAGVGA